MIENNYYYIGTEDGKWFYSYTSGENARYVEKIRSGAIRLECIGLARRILTELSSSQKRKIGGYGRLKKEVLGPLIIWREEQKLSRVE